MAHQIVRNTFFDKLCIVFCSNTDLIDKDYIITS